MDLTWTKVVTVRVASFFEGPIVGISNGCGCLEEYGAVEFEICCEYV